MISSLPLTSIKLIFTHFEVLLVSVDCRGHQEVKDPESNEKEQEQSIHDVPKKKQTLIYYRF